jgi:hypothetical protein
MTSTPQVISFGFSLAVVLALWYNGYRHTLAFNRTALALSATDAFSKKEC